MSRPHMRGVDLVMSLPCLWQLGGGVLVASHNEFDDLSDLDETHATGRVPLTRVVAGRLHAARGRPAEEQWAWRRRGGKKAGKKDERGASRLSHLRWVSRSRCCEYPAEQKSIGRHCLAVGQTMPPSAKMSQSLMTRPVAAPGIHETGIQSDFASRWTGHGRRAPFFFFARNGGRRPHTPCRQRGSQGKAKTHRRYRGAFRGQEH